MADQNATAANIMSTLYSAANILIRKKESELTNCIISDKQIMIKLKENLKATVNISICTTCNEEQLIADIEDDFRNITSEDIVKDILIVDASSTEITVDIVEGNERGVDESTTTTKIISDTLSTMNNGGTFWSAIVPVLAIIMLCFVGLCVVIYIKKKQADKEFEKEMDRQRSKDNNINSPNNKRYRCNNAPLERVLSNTEYTDDYGDFTVPVHKEMCSDELFGHGEVSVDDKGTVTDKFIQYNSFNLYISLF